MSPRIKACIVDDERPARDELKFLIEEHFKQVEIVGMYDNSGDAFDYLKNNKCDLIFLDIEMPEETGVEFAERMNQELEQVPYIIFVTAYDKFAIKAFELDAVDYLLKPVMKAGVERAILKMEERINTKQSQNQGEISQIMNILSNIHGPQEKTSHITFNQGDNLIPVHISEIIYATIRDKQTYVYTSKGKFGFPGTLGELEEQLNDLEFFRGHKSFLINLSAIENIKIWFNSSFQVKLKGVDELIPISRKQAKRFKKLLNIK